MFIIAVGYAALSGLLYSLYLVAIKKCSEDRIIIFFWTNIITYLIYLGIYFFYNIITKHKVQPVQELIHNFTLTNAPFYFLMACFWVGSLLILDYLLNRHELSLIIPITHIGILISVLGYTLLGDTYPVEEFIGKCFIFIGAIITSYRHVSIKTLFSQLKKVPFILLLAGLIEALLSSGAKWITFLCTEKTPVTRDILEWAQGVSYKVDGPSFGFHTPFYYNVGVRFFIALIFIIYIFSFTNDKNKIFSVFYKKFWNIMIVSFFFTSFIITYNSAFLLFQDKSILIAISKITVPITLLISYWILKEKITQPKIIGTTLIMIGALLNFIF